MKFTAIALLALPALVCAQPVIDASIIPTEGQKITLQRVQNAPVTEGAGGVNINWNFSTLNAGNNETYSLTFVDPAATPFADSFVFANLASEYTDNGQQSYAYFHKTGTELWMLGAATTGGYELYDNPNLLVRTPMAFTQEAAHEYSGIFNYDGFMAGITGAKTLQYDGYGTLTLPNRTFNNAIRVRALEMRTDSAAFEGGAYTLNINSSVSYGWYVPGIIFSVMEIRYNTFTSKTVIPGFPPQIMTQPVEKTITWQPNVVTDTREPVKNTGLSVQLKSANPTIGDMAKFEICTDITTSLTVLVSNAQGQILSASQVNAVKGPQQHEVDLSGLPAGIYQVAFVSKTGIQTVSVVKA